MNKKGFTLVELLVVIAIIALLSTLSVVALNSARQKSRNAKRLSDIKQIQTALEMYFDSKLTYPPSSATPGGNCLSTTNGFAPTCSGITLMEKVPTDPLNDTNYKYSYTLKSATDYEITYKLEPDSATVKKATPSGLGN